jgi:flagellar biogenesis protein FliO
MSIVVKIIAVIALGVFAMYLLRRLAENIVKLNISLRKNNMYDVSKQKHSIVYNKRTGKLEADQSLILPF